MTCRTFANTLTLLDRTLETLEARIDLLNGLVSRLFPKHNPEQLAVLSREELVRLVLREDDASTSPDSQPTPAVPALATMGNVTTLPPADRSTTSPQTAPQSSAGADDLSALEQAPERDPAADEAQRYGRQMQSLSDDVNALSISVRRKASYVGVSSISAALEVMFTVEPFARAYMAQDHIETANPSRRNSQDHSSLDFDTDPTALPPPDVGERHIETYFTRVHPLMPMIDEQEFRDMYLYTNRKDTPWLVLLNMVLALGALANPAATKDEHLIFSYRVRTQFSLELFGSGNLFVLQALGLLTGYYLHWLSRPNEANALMGAALRMAIAMGLHREFHRPSQTGLAEIPVETRRRTWWSLVCLDTWSAMTTGRPSLGRLGTGITVESPKIPEQTNNAQYLASIKLLPLVHNVKFCKLATNIQDKLATLTILPAAELNVLDAELVQWHDDLPPILMHATVPHSRYSSIAGLGLESSSSHEHTYNEGPEQLKMPRLVLYWWYMTLRVLAHRPLLLSTALRRLPFGGLSEEERTIVAKCQKLAGHTIEDIDRSCPDEMIASWTAVWLMYQAVMVPLVSVFLHTSLQHTTGARAASDEEVEAWRQQIRTAISFYSRKDVNISQKCKVMLQRLYDANCTIEQATVLPTSGSYLPDSQWDSGMPSRSTQFVPMTVDSLDRSPSGANLDQWLQTYEESLDASTAWNDMMWAYSAGSREVNEEALFEDLQFSTTQPPVDYANAGQSFY